MRKTVTFQNNSEIRDFSEYDSNKLAVARVCVLSTAPNSHNLEISEDVLRRDIGSIRGNFLVADMEYGDATTHSSKEVPVGYFPTNEPIEFEEVEINKKKIVKAWAIAVLSKKYAKEAYEMFVKDNRRPTSIEMSVLTDEDDENKVVAFDAYSSTILGKFVAPSCKDAEISLVRFAEEANSFFDKRRDSVNSLKQFVEERKKQMAEQEKLVSHPIDTSKEAMYDGEWDGQKTKQDLVKEKNFKTLAPKVCMKLESGWEDREVTKLGYPVMMLHDGKWVYSTKGLASALGYAKKENETEVINKVKKIYKKLGLDSDRKEEDAKMAEIAFAAVDIGDMWGRVFDALHDRYPDGDWGSVYRIDGIYEQDNKKFAIIHRKDEDVKYRLDFSLTEEGLTLADEIVKIEMQIVETDDVKKFAEPEGAEKYMQFEIEGRKAWAKVIKKVQDHEGESAYVDSIEDDHIIYTKYNVRYRVEADIKVDADDKSVDADIKWDTVKKDADQKMGCDEKQEDMSCDGETKEMSCDEMKAEMERLNACIEERDNIIMDKDKELEELRKFKADIEAQQVQCVVDNLFAEVKNCFSADDITKFQEEAKSCTIDTVTGFVNKVKAFAFEATKGAKNTATNDTIMRMSVSVNTQVNKSNSVWDRI